VLVTESLPNNRRIPGVKLYGSRPVSDDQAYDTIKTRGRVATLNSSHVTLAGVLLGLTDSPDSGTIEESFQTLERITGTCEGLMDYTPRADMTESPFEIAKGNYKAKLAEVREKLATLEQDSRLS